MKELQDMLSSSRIHGVNSQKKYFNIIFALDLFINNIRHWHSPTY